MGGVDIPSNYTVTLLPSPLLTGVTVDAGLDDIRIKEIPRIELGSESAVELRSQSTVGLESNSRVALDSNSQVNLGDIVIRLRELPSVRVHFPTRFDFGVAVFGLEVLNFSLCGEAMVVSEPYVPNLCEVCGRATDRDRSDAGRDTVEG